MKKYISKTELINMGACEKGLNRFIEQTNNTDADVLISSLFNGKNTVSDLIWLAGEICDIEKIRKFARDIALINIELIKPYCSDSEYTLILNFLKTGENADAAARVAARVARVAADAADAADAAARAATYATYAATGYVYAARTNATYTTAAADGRIDFTPYLQELFS